MRFWLLLLIAGYAQAKTVKKTCEKNFDLIENEETNINIHLKEKRFIIFMPHKLCIKPVGLVRVSAGRRLHGPWSLNVPTFCENRRSKAYVK